ncbi:hypothetical protein [Candidatus Aquiluna sp. UB-MaderosW2red]|uniref:hypothetical protein n=1 Tax=Candidatus Aquiluna sp. UB-MaderosW2red TaxID=1855377 RepID=UPI000875B204|nr:hypothetical protein [Candidatus Aquiluna sp. UB-MaderosW2red]SCX05914.1 Nucleotidyltransferase [Candidatus Aquiluna sp. UB-MaderosW2red]
MVFGAKSTDVVARRTLLGALETLPPHLDSLILVGAQAVYLNSNHIELPLAPATSDADIAFDTRSLEVIPEIGKLLKQAGYLENALAAKNPGHWINAEGVPLDLFQPRIISTRGVKSRSANLGPPDQDPLRIIDGLNSALVDNSVLTVNSFETQDIRSFEIKVAGPAALIIVKTAKISDRLRGSDHTLISKDAHDVYRPPLAKETQLRGQPGQHLREDRQWGFATQLFLRHISKLIGPRTRSRRFQVLQGSASPRHP